MFSLHTESMAINIGLNKVVVVVLHRRSDCTFMIFNAEMANIKHMLWNWFVCLKAYVHRSVFT